jgi:maleate isomerase
MTASPLTHLTETPTMSITAETPDKVARADEKHLRIGMLLPSSNPCAEPEVVGMLPDGFSVLTTRLKLAGSTREELLGMTEKVEEAASLLADAAVDLIVFNCTAVSTFDPAMGSAIAKRIQDAAGVTATSTSDALLAAFKALNVKRMVLITPYVKEVNLREIEFFKHYGIETLAETGLGLLEGTGMAAVTPNEWIRLAKEMRNDDADVYFLSCTAIRVSSIIDILERELGRPVVTSNQAMLWHCLRSLGFNEKIDGFGALFSAH